MALPVVSVTVIRAQFQTAFGSATGRLGHQCPKLLDLPLKVGHFSVHLTQIGLKLLDLLLIATNGIGLFEILGFGPKCLFDPSPIFKKEYLNFISFLFTTGFCGG